MLSSAQNDHTQARTQGFMIAAGGVTLADNREQWINGLRDVYCQLRGDPALQAFLPANLGEGIHGFINKDEFYDTSLPETQQALADGVQIDALDMTGPGSLSLAGRVGLSAQAGNDLTVNWSDLHWPPQGDPSITSPDGRLSVQGTWTALRFDADAGIGPQARITAQGDWSPDNIDAPLAWTDLADFKNPSQSIWRSKRGRLDVTGVPEDYRFELNGELVARELPGKIAGEGQGNLQGLHLQRFVLEALQGS